MSPASPDPTYLLVPMHVDALVIGQPPRLFKWASFAPHFSELQDSYATGFDVRLNQMLRKAATTALKQGIHLHFKLPAALTHGAGSGDLQFPRIPNRWLVQRYDSDIGRLSKAWIVRSDTTADAGSDAVPLPVFPSSPSKYDAPLSLRPTGVCSVIFDGGRLLSPMSLDDTSSELELTAVTGGDAGFSAHYAACRSMLGLYDNMTGVSSGVRLSYLVTGWYSSPDDDPWHQLAANLKAAPTSADATARLEQWLNEHRCARAFDTLNDLPSGMLCHGLVAGVPWDATCDYSTAKPFTRDHPLFGAFNVPPFEFFTDSTRYSVDIGNSSAEAVASLIAGASHHQDLLEDVLTGIQTGLMSAGANSGSAGIDVAQIDEEVHRRGFASVAGGIAWALRPSEPAMQGTPEQRPRPLPRHLQDLLDDLNARQIACNRHARLQADYRRELHALWYRWTSALIEDGPADLLRENLDGLRAFLANFDRLPDVAGAREKRDAARQALLDALAQEAAEDAQEYSLEESAAAPFYLPADPVFVMSGPAMKPAGTQTQDGAVPCRVTGEEIAGYTYDEPNGAVGIQVTAAACMDGRVQKDYLDAIPAEARRLLGEALVLDDVNRLDPAKRRLAKEHPFGGGIKPDDISRFRWEHNPWRPLYLAWEVEWRSDYDVTGLPDNLIAERWTFGDEAVAEAQAYTTRTDLTLRPDARASSADSSTRYCGFSLLQPVADRNGDDTQAPATVTMLIAKTLSDRLQNRDRPMLAHTAGGFHDALIMRRVGDQLPPLDYRRYAADRALFLDRIADDLGSASVFDSSPASDTPFLPLRSGAMTVRRLWIVDAFGQTIWLDPAPAAGHAVRIAAGPPDGDGYVPLRPRFSQPMRLAFAAAAAGNPESVAPPSSPVCGWIVPNHLEQSLTLYAANGAPAGVLQRRFRPTIGGGQPAFYWVDVPGPPTHVSAGPSPESTIENSHLRDFARFVLSLDADQGAAFARLIDEAISATERRVPEEDPGVSVLVGRPLALIRATLRLEAPGLYALDQQASWQARDRIAERLTAGFDGVVSSETSDLLKTGGAERVRCPVRLGDRRTANDGLIGCFVGDPAAGPRPFLASWGFDVGNVRYPDVLETQDQASSGPALAVDGVTPLAVTLFMDPQARVYATTGVLPRAFLELRAAESAGAKQARDVFFQTAPVLGTPAAPQVPTPSDDYGEWSWAYRPDVTLWAEDPAVVSATNRAGLSVPYPAISEGWLKLKIASVRILSLWIKNGVAKPKKDADIWLAWSVYGADALRLDKLLDGGGRMLMREWSDAPLGREIKMSVDRKTTFELTATDRSGNADRKQITIEIDEA
ncbi:MAG: hypothetical protein LAO77_01730 [Acidobacteriia bacterium]|nr:hypothetical protein [Terriglobia bacterium]